MDKDIIEQSTEQTVVNQSNVDTSNKVDSKENVEENQKNDLIPRSRLNEVISQKNDLKTKIEELQSNYDKLVKEKEEEVNSYKSKVDEVSENLNKDINLFKNKYEETIYKNSNVGDIEYLKFLVNQKDGLDLEQAIEVIKSEKPDLFLENRKRIGEVPNGNDSKLTPEQFSQIKDRNKRMEIIRKGLI